MKRSYSVRTALMVVCVLTVLSPLVRAFPDAFGKGRRDEEIRKLKARIRELEIEASACRVRVDQRCPQQARPCANAVMASARKFTCQLLYALTFPWTYATFLKVLIATRDWVGDGGVQRLLTQIYDGTHWRRLIRRIRWAIRWAHEFTRNSLQTIKAVPQRTALLILHGVRSSLQFFAGVYTRLERTIGRNNIRFLADIGLVVAFWSIFLVPPIAVGFMAARWGLLAAQNVAKLFLRACFKTIVALQTLPAAISKCLRPLQMPPRRWYHIWIFQPRPRRGPLQVKRGFLPGVVIFVFMYTYTHSLTHTLTHNMMNKIKFSILIFSILSTGNTLGH